MANTKIVDDPVLHQLRMERELMKELDEMAKKERRSRNSLIVEMIEYALEYMPEQ